MFSPFHRVSPQVSTSPNLYPFPAVIDYKGFKNKEKKGKKEAFMASLS